MSNKLIITNEQLQQMEELTGNKIVEVLEPGYKFKVLIKKSNKVEQWYSDKVIRRINYELEQIKKREEAEKGLSFNSLFSSADKRTAKIFKTLGTSVESEVYDQVKKLAEKHNMTIHTLLKRMVMQLLEADKQGKF